MSIKADYHKGKPIIETIGKVVVLLCPYRHLLDSMPIKEWAGSGAEANWPHIQEVECYGTLPR